MQNKQAILQPDGIYHIYNRANGSERLFVCDENYRYFLHQYKKYITPIADTYCYCLMPNHFHFLVRVKSVQTLLEIFPEINWKEDLTGFENLSGLLSKQFSNLFNAYTKAFNKQHNRKGSLFMRPFKRKKITNSKYLLKLIHYIHFNPVEAGLCDSLESWTYSSFQSLISKKTTTINRTEVLKHFNDLENFLLCHNASSTLLELEI